MSWVRASSRHEEAVLRLILRDEARCVSASSRLRAETGKCMLYVNESAEAAGELILYTEYGLLLPILPEGGTDGEALKRILLELRPPLHSIMGVSRWVRRIEALMPLQPSTGIQYNLMTVTERDVAPVAGRPFTPVIRRASPMDAEALFPLQRDYEREEVVVNPRIFNELQT